MPAAFAGAAIYTVAHGLVKGALFLLAGILLHCLGTVDEHELGEPAAAPIHGDRVRRRRARPGRAFPRSARDSAKSLIEEAGRQVGARLDRDPAHRRVRHDRRRRAPRRRTGVPGLGPARTSEADATPGDEARETAAGRRARARGSCWRRSSSLLLLAALCGTGLGPCSRRSMQAARRFTDPRRLSGDSYSMRRELVRLLAEQSFRLLPVAAVSRLS